MTKAREGYGQVYRTDCYAYIDGSEEYPYAMAFRGILMDESGKEVFRGRAKGTPVDAHADMRAHAKEHGITDLRRWSGHLPAAPVWTP